jgi:hypothetical protein
MTDELTDAHLRDAYQQALAERTGPGRPECPDLEALLAVVQRDGPEMERFATLDHALACPACRRELEVLRTMDQATRAVTGERDAARGERRAGRRVMAWRAVPLALAASLALVVGLTVGRERWNREPDEPMRAAQDGIALVTPEEGAAVSLPAPLMWRPVPGARWYVVEVVTEEGTVPFSARTTDTSLTVPPTPGVGPGQYRWTVRAQLSNGVQRRSAAWRLRIRTP